MPRRRFWIALALVAVFTYGAATLGLPPRCGFRRSDIRHAGRGAARVGGSFVDLARHAVLPVATLAAVGAAGIARYARSAVADVLHEGWVGTARAKGARPRECMPARAAERHAAARRARRALASGPRRGIGVRGIGVRVAGLGKAMLVAIQARDYPVVMGATVVLRRRR